MVYKKIIIPVSAVQVPDVDQAGLHGQNRPDTLHVAALAGFEHLLLAVRAQRLGGGGGDLEETDLLFNSSTNINTNTYLKRCRVAAQFLEVKILTFPNFILNIFELFPDFLKQICSETGCC